MRRVQRAKNNSNANKQNLILNKTEDNSVSSVAILCSSNPIFRGKLDIKT